MPCLRAYAPSGIRTPTLWLESRELEPLHHSAPTKDSFFLLQCVHPAAQRMSPGRGSSRSCCSVSARGGGEISTSCRSCSRSSTITTEIEPRESSRRATLPRCSSSQDGPRDLLPSSTRSSCHSWQPISFRQMSKLQPSKRYLFFKDSGSKASFNKSCLFLLSSTGQHRWPWPSSGIARWKLSSGWRLYSRWPATQGMEYFTRSMTVKIVILI